MADLEHSNDKDLLFVSWTNRDGLGKELGEAFSNFFAYFDLGIEVFYSDRDLGSDWYHVLNENLQRAKFGVFCITPKAVNSEWVNYELGSILNNRVPTCKAVKKRVFPIQLSNTDRINRDKTPFAHNNVKKFCEDELEKLIDSLLKEYIFQNKIEADIALDKHTHVNRIFKLAFGELKQRVEDILAKEKPEEVKAEGSSEDKKIIEQLKADLAKRQSEVANLSKLKTENADLKSEIIKLEHQIKVIQTPIQKPSYVSVTDQHPAIDLGLSVLWATCNVGADNEWESGDYFSWGETSPKTINTWATYKYAKDTYNQLTKYCTHKAYGNNGFTDGLKQLKPKDDAATANWGSDWCMPTVDQIYELKEKCNWTWTTKNGIKGYIVTGPNGNSLFLPAAGYRDVTELGNVGSNGYYWSRSLDESRPSCARCLSFHSSCVAWSHITRIDGSTVRPVRCK